MPIPNIGYFLAKPCMIKAKAHRKWSFQTAKGKMQRPVVLKAVKAVRFKMLPLHD